VSPISYPSLPLVESHEYDVADALSIPAAVCPGYPTVVDDEVLLDFPPADLPPDADGFRIVVTHVDDDCHIYGHALRSGIQCATLTGYSSLFMELSARFVVQIHIRHLLVIHLMSDAAVHSNILFLSVTNKFFTYIHTYLRCTLCTANR